MMMATRHAADVCLLEGRSGAAGDIVYIVYLYGAGAAGRSGHPKASE